ncbi:hypothetical protein HY382_00515, partial [Candidatus Curtissbacteria bacterium]|nr:hypothetical protein [Candidatus Curtissbacteria bacterium]
MPNDTETKLDPKLLLQVAQWSISYVLDPQRGAGKRFPTVEEIEKAFPGTSINPDFLKTYLFEKLHITTLEEIIQDPEGLEEKLTEVESGGIKEPLSKAEPVQPKTNMEPTPTKTVQFSAAGILEEIDVALKNTKDNNQLKSQLETTLTKRAQDSISSLQTKNLNPPEIQKLATSTTTPQANKASDESLRTVRPLIIAAAQELTPKITASIQTLVDKSLPGITKQKFTPEEVKQISAEVTLETVREITENIGAVASHEQIPALIADSITQTLIAHPALEGKVKLPEARIFEKFAPQAVEIATQNQKVLEKAAVLNRISLVLQKPTQKAAALIETVVNDTIDLKTPLVHPAARTAVRNETFSFISNYQTAFAA